MAFARTVRDAFSDDRGGSVLLALLAALAVFGPVLNLLVPDCNRIATALTDGDLAYLKALYKMTPANTLSAQRGEMRYQMQQALK